MTLSLRDYQQSAKDSILHDWINNRNVMAVLPTGAGKTVLFGSIINDHKGAVCAIAHRQELVGQISMALARYGVRHKIIGPTSTVRSIIAEHHLELGASFYDPNSNVSVAGVDTLVRRTSQLSHYLKQVTLWVIDEAHHVLDGNKWGKAVNMFPNARGLGVTATPSRADGRGLGRHTDGVMDSMIEGPSMRELIDRGFLCDYRIFAPPSDLDMSSVTVSDRTGEYNAKKLKKAVQKSHLVGDVVQHYLRIASGKQGVTFATDVETATDISKQFNDNGVKAEVVSAKTPDRIRNEIIRRFRRKELQQLVNVDLFGEGFDLPAIEVVSMARPTQSYGLYIQQFGRALRLCDGKEYGIIIDHAGNVVRHGLPDKPRVWSLDAREKRPKLKNPEDDIPLRYCVECTQPYERIIARCPYCGHYPIPAGRDKPEYVDGDLTEMSPDLLAEMRGEIARIQQPPEYVANRLEQAGAPLAASRGAYSNHKKRQEAQAELSDSIAWWAGYQKHAGRTDSESYRLFYHLFGMDVLTAQALGRPDAITLKGKLDGHIGELHARTLQQPLHTTLDRGGN